MSDHTHKQFDAEMEEIRSGVLAMGGLVETQLTRAIDALKHPDIDLIASVATDERAINQMQVSIDQQCSQIIAKRQPAAIDLRMVLTVVKIVNELERIGDEIKKIAYKAQQMQRPERLSNVRFHEITRAAERTTGCTLDSAAHVKSEHVPGRAPEPRQAATHTAPWPRFPSAMRPWTPQHDALKRYKVTHHGTEKKRPASTRIRN